MKAIHEDAQKIMLEGYIENSKIIWAAVFTLEEPVLVMMLNHHN